VTSQIISSLVSHLKIIRPLNSIIAFFSTFIGSLIILGLDDYISNIEIIVIGSLITFFVSAGGFIINDIFDIEIDKINAPNRPLPSNQISIRQAYFYAYFLFFISIILSFFVYLLPTTLNLGYFPPLITIIVILTLYSYAKLFKRLGLIGNLIITLLSGLPFLVAGLVIGNIFRGLYLMALAILLSYSREIIKDVQDIEGDVQGIENMYSLPVLIGISNSIKIAKGILICMLLIIPLPIFFSELDYFYSWGMILVGLTLGLSTVAVFIILRGEEKELIEKSYQSKQLLKYSMIFALIGLLLNPFTLI
jgi:geranylgeranylglycerol-phosphate geranylgeranyltransferase